MEAKRAKNARVRRVLTKREPKLIENPRVALLVRGQKTSGLVNSALTDLFMLKKPYAVHFKRHNAVHPFEDVTSLEFLCQKNDASIFAFGTHSKKRPQVRPIPSPGMDVRSDPLQSSPFVTLVPDDTCTAAPINALCLRRQNLVFGRMYDHHLLDMAELGIEAFRPMVEFAGINGGCAAESKPCLLFEGAEWEHSADLQVAPPSPLPPQPEGTPCNASLPLS
jgi:ribosome production factor 2